MPLNEADTRAKLIDPVLDARGMAAMVWREVTKPKIEIDTTVGKGRRKGGGRVDYLLRYGLNQTTQPLALRCSYTRRAGKGGE